MYSTRPCPKCGGKRCNIPEDKENYGRCYTCHSRWFIVQGGNNHK